MKKRNSKGRFTYDKNWYIRNYEKILFLLSVIVLAYMYFVTIAEAHENPLELSCGDFVSPVSCDEIYGFNNLKIEEPNFWVEAPHAYEIEPIEVTAEAEPSIEEKIKEVFGEDGELMIKVARCESNLNPKAKNSTSSARGLFQILSKLHQVKEQWLYDENVNIAIAKQMFDASGTNPWIASINCWGK
jgi:hypothetical protein